MTVSDVVREALAEYVAAGEQEAAKLADEADSEAEDARFAQAVLARIAEGAPTYSHEEVWDDARRVTVQGIQEDRSTRLERA